jgi:hypothetical protein
MTACCEDGERFTRLMRAARQRGETDKAAGWKRAFETHRRISHPPRPQRRGAMGEPRPTKGCDVCAALSRQRAAAKKAGHMSKVAECDDEIQRHPHARVRK